MRLSQKIFLFCFYVSIIVNGWFVYDLLRNQVYQKGLFDGQQSIFLQFIETAKQKGMVEIDTGKGEKLTLILEKGK